MNRQGDFTESQVQYIEEVLGTSPSSFSKIIPADAPVTKTYSAIVLTAAQTPEAKDLLSKILGSVQLEHYLPLEAEDGLPSGYSAPHILNFTGRGEPGRHPQDGSVWWNFPKLEDMLSGSPAVAEAKKRTWSLLQLYAGEARQ